MSHAVCLLSAVPLRAEPSHRSEMVSQLLFAEFAGCIEEQKEFTRVRCLYDGYEGWVQSNQLVTVHRIMEPLGYFNSWSSAIYISGKSIQVLFGSPLVPPSYLGEELHQTVSFDVQDHLPVSTPFSPSKLLEFATVYLNTPYMWGGRSVFGIDCSGFVQQVFKLFGVKLLRDAYLQAEQGVEVKGLSDSKAGDLAFFNNEAGRITHVGIVLEDGKIIHASGKVRIDHLTEESIVNADTGVSTHHLHSIRRHF